MKEFTPPNPTNIDRVDLRVFAGGSIEMDTAEEWQPHLAKLLRNAEKPQIRPISMLNPRRKDWDSSWKQSIDDENFLAQVTWELDEIEEADVVILYFQSGTKSPISLLELGLCAGLFPEKLIVICPDGFWRKGNVDIVCDRYGIKQVSSLFEAVNYIMDHIDEW